MKIFGFVLIILSSAVCGSNYVATKKERLKQLSSFAKMLELIIGELSTNLLTLPDIINTLEKKLENKSLQFIKTLSLNLSLLGEKDFNTIWSKSFESCFPAFSEQESNAMVSLGLVLGKYDLETQIRALNECLAVLRTSEKNLSNELPQLNRLSFGLSISAGAMLAILLI